MTRVNRNLLILAKIENNQFDGKEKVNLSETIHKVKAELENNFGLNEGVLTEEIKTVIIISGNHTLIEIMIGNLISNAICYNKQVGNIKISLEKAKLTISNGGDNSLNEDKL